MSTGRVREVSSTDRKLEELRRIGKEDGVIAGVVCEYIERMNRGEVVDKKALIDGAPASVQGKLRDDLDFTEALLMLGRTWRARQQQKVNAACGAPGSPEG